MPDANDWNQGIITEFRANEGRVGGPFEGAPMILVHHVGRTSGKEYTTPLVYLPGEGGDDSMYIFASKGGAPTNPGWYGNLVAAGEATVEVGTRPSASPSPRSPATNATASTPSRSAHARLRRLREADRGHPHDPGAPAHPPLARTGLPGY